MNGKAQFDVVVAGAGGAGTTAALRATEAGRSVLLLDSLASFRRGCNTYMSTSMIPAAGTRWQAELGIDDSPQRFYDDVMRKTNGSASPTLTRALVDVGSELVSWLADSAGVPLVLGTDFRYPGHSADRCHSVPERSGRELHRRMMARVDADDRITLASPMRLVDVTLDDRGKVAEAVIDAPGGSRERVATSAVVLATGGFGADRGLVSQHIPEIAGALYFGSEGSDGAALRIGLGLGTDTGYLDAYQGHGSVAVPEGILLTWITVTHGAVLINAHGARFGDESTGYSEFARYVIAQPGGVAWMVFDRRIDELCRPFQDYADLLAANGVRWCRDAREIAGLVGAPNGAVEETLAACGDSAGGAPDPFGRTNWEAPLTPPFAAVRVTGALFHTQGGILVDGNAQALRGGVPVPGLYAAGGAAAGISGHGPAGYIAGNGLLAAFGLGYLAGRHLAGAVRPDEAHPEATL